MAAVYGIFFAEVAAYRIGTAKLARLGVNYSSHADDHTDAHAHDHGLQAPLAVDTTGPSDPLHVHPSRVHPTIESPTSSNVTHSHDKSRDLEKDDFSFTSEPSSAEASAQLIGVAVLEIGVILHSVIIGLTLAVNEEFTTLFVVIIFHQMFEGLGLGSRLSALVLPERLWWARWVAAAVYSVCTPIGIAAGLGVRETYNGNGATVNIVSGTLDAISAGILLYTGLVELLAHEIVLNPRMMKASTGRLAYIFTCMLIGSGLMALLGRWA